MCSSMNFPARNLHLVQMFPTSLMKIVTFFPDFSGQIPPHGRSADLHPTFAQALKALASPTLAKHFYLWKPPSRVARKISTPLMFEGLNHWKKKTIRRKYVGYFTIKQKLVGWCWMFYHHQQPPSTATPRLSPKLRQMLAASSAMATAWLLDLDLAYNEWGYVAKMSVLCRFHRISWRVI